MFRGNVAAQEILAGRGSAGDDRQKLHEKDDYPESNCRNLVVVPSKLQHVIKAQQATVEKLRAVDGASVEYRIEDQTLQRLLDAQEKLIKPEAA